MQAPKGSALAAARIRAHAAFDPLWKSGEMTRKQAYNWLAKRLNVKPSEAHMLNMDEATCERVVQIISQRSFERLV